MSRRDITTTPADKTERFDAGNRTQAEKVAIGQWYWVSDTVSYEGQWTDDDGRKMKSGETVRWLGCIMQIGSNYVEIESPPRKNYGGSSERIHFDNFDDRLEFEPNAEAYIESQRVHYQQKVNQLLAEVQEVTKRLGVVPTQQIGEHVPHAETGQNALVAISGKTDTDAYKKALVKAKEKTLPELFKQIEEAHEHLAKWMLAPTMPVRAGIGPMKKSVDAVEDRIYTIELYAGLTEDAVQCCEGDPAAIGEKLRVMQRLLYMDEESLLSYSGGGLEFKEIGKFDEWISDPENRDRLLPFPRCLAAFRVRRDEKSREDGGDLWKAWVNFGLAEADKTTFLYVRNGDQVWRVDCDFVFDEMIVPNREEFDPSEPMMVRMFAGSVKETMPRRRWDSLKETYDKHRAWMEEFDGKPKGPNRVYYSGDSPFYSEIGGFRPSEWKPFDPSNVYFDEALKHIDDQVKKYNRIAVIIQGLFDRSMVLHPHGPVRVWDPASFEQSIELVYDATTLTHGDAPDFEAYRAELNKSIDADSVVTGQQDFWMRREAERENERQQKDWRRERKSHYYRFKPYGDPGPGLVSRMADWKPRAKKAVFRWMRAKQDWRAGYGEKTPATVTVPAEELLNVSAYKPGDFKKFLSDPRTRRDYLKWAPLMLAAEDYHAGKIKIGEAAKMADRYVAW